MTAKRKKATKEAAALIAEFEHAPAELRASMMALSEEQRRLMDELKQLRAALSQTKSADEFARVAARYRNAYEASHRMERAINLVIERNRERRGKGE